MNILVISAHPDDEVLGMGGTIKKLSKKNKIHLCVVTEGASAQYTDKKMIEIRKNACYKAGKILGISTFHFLDFPDMLLDTIPHLEINKKLENVFSKVKPEIVFTTPPNDLNLDHQKVFESTLVCARPLSSNVKKIYFYEIPSYKIKSFEPTTFIDISKEISFKLKAFNCYKSEIRKFPHPRSKKAIENLSTYRGILSGVKNAEAFRLIREVI